MRCSRLLPIPLVIALMLVVSSTSGCAAAIVSLALGAERGRADLHEGVSSEGIVYLERNPADDAPVVVMLHGFGGNKDHWTRFCGTLPSELRLLVPDLPGFGDSPKISDESYDYASQVDRLARFLRERGVRRFHLMGNSMGGYLATAYALAHPDEVESLVLFDPAGLKGPIPARMDVLKESGTHPLIIRTEADFDQLISLSFVTPPRIPGFLKGYFAARAAAGGAFSDKVRADIARRPRPIDEEIRALVPPTLVVWGDSDQIIHPSAVPLWRERVPGHLVVVLPQTGHAPMLERPGESGALVLAWWRQLLQDRR